MKSRHKAFVGVFLLFVILVVPACTSVRKPSGFLTESGELVKGGYFIQEYVPAGTNFSTYRKAKVSEVDIRYLEDFRGNLTEFDRRDLALKLKTSLESELGKRYQILSISENPDKNTLVISPALVYVSTPHRIINAATFWFFNLSFSKGSAAFEAKITDGKSGRVLAEVAEKRMGGGGLADIKSILIGGFLKFAHAEGAFKRWGKDMAHFVSAV